MRMIIDLRNKMELIVALKKIRNLSALINNRTISVWLNFLNNNQTKRITNLFLEWDNEGIY